MYRDLQEYNVRLNKMLFDQFYSEEERRSQNFNVASKVNKKESALLTFHMHGWKCFWVAGFKIIGILFQMIEYQINY